MNLIQAFGIEVRRRRLDLYMSLDELADRAGISPIQLGKVERGAMASGAGLGVVEKIAKGLKVAPGRLLGPVKRLTPVAYEAAELLMTLDTNQQAAVLAIIKALAPKRRK